MTAKLYCFMTAGKIVALTSDPGKTMSCSFASCGSDAWTTGSQMMPLCCMQVHMKDIISSLLLHTVHLNHMLTAGKTVQVG